MDRLYRQKPLESTVVHGGRRYDFISPRSGQILSLQIPLGPIPYVNHGCYARYSEHLS